MATGNPPNVQGTSGYQRELLQRRVNQDGQAPDGAGVVSNGGAADRQPKTMEKAPGGPLEQDPLAGKGALFEMSDAEAFRLIDALVKRQEPLAKNRLAIDRHYTATKNGYWGSMLVKVENQSQWQQSFLPGTRDRLQSGAVPNKSAELVQKLTETLLVDPPVLEPEADDDDETAQRGAELAREFLHQDAGEAGTDDLTLFADRFEAAATRAASYTYYWVDQSGGGAMPKQIKAHPQATDPANPLDAIGPDGIPIPTTDYVLRYVTAGDGEDGAPPQFTENPSEAEQVWLPKIRVERLGREHVRFYPETADLHGAQQTVVLWYCTVAEARRRWPETVGQMTDAEILPLTTWTPLRPAVLLPAALRTQWKRGVEAARTGDGKDLSAMDQRYVFYYHYFCRSEPDYPEGCDLAISGASGGYVLGKDTLSATVEVPSGVVQDETVTETKPLDIPLSQVKLLPDVDEGDPTGAPFMARFAGAGEAGSTMATAMMEAIDQVLHPVRYSIGTSSVDPDDVESARMTGDFVPVLNKDEVPQLEEPRPLPNDFFAYQGFLYDQMDASAGLRPPDSAREAKVKSGVALRIEVQEANKTLTRMNYAGHVAWERHGRIKLQLAMKHFRTSQLLRYTGTDGAAKQEWFTGNDFARAGKVTIKSGTGTMLPPLEKVNLAIQLQGAALVDPDEAADVARPAFAKQLGMTENPHVQRIERQVSAWLEGPPEGWEEQAVAFQQEQAVIQQQQAAMAIPDPMTGQMVAPPAPPPTVPPPWTPFAVEPMDAEPPIAAIRKRRLARLMAKVEFSEQPESWKQVVRDAYNQSVASLQAAQMAQAAAAAPQPGAGAPRQIASGGAESTAPSGAEQANVA